MADPAPAPAPAAPDPAAPPAADGTPTLPVLADKVDRLTGLVERVLQGAHPAAEAAVQGRLDSPGMIADLVRRELASKSREDQLADVAGKVETHGQTLAQLAEVPPKPPVTRRHRFMGWGE